MGQQPLERLRQSFGVAGRDDRGRDVYRYRVRTVPQAAALDAAGRVFGVPVMTGSQWMGVVRDGCAVEVPLAPVPG